MNLDTIPALNASLNALATLLLTLGFVFIKRGQKEAHRKAMFSACIVSAVFLVGYLGHKFLKGMAAGAGEAVHTQFGGEGPIRTSTM
jgi:putative membrane protein